MISTPFEAQAAYADGMVSGLVDGYSRSASFPDLGYARSGYWWNGYADGLTEGLALTECARPATARRIREASRTRLAQWQRIRDTASLPARSA